MKIFVPREADPEETRAPLLPADAEKLAKLGGQVQIEAGTGESISISDKAYEDAGATISSDRAGSLSAADMVLRISIPDKNDIKHLSAGCIHVSLLDPFIRIEIVKAMADQKVSAISLGMIPRTTLAQKMDVLTSQANLAGYAAAVLAAHRHMKILPMMMTPSGTITPARVFIIGAGVAGLQAIATTRRLGARVDAFDVRPDAQEQILSLGAKPLTVDLGKTGATKEGYARELTDEQLEKQRQALAKQCAQSDVIITTAKVFGKRAPLIVTNRMVDGMKPGSVVIDLAVETGGNVEASEVNKEVIRKGVTIIGSPALERRVPMAASQMFSSNLYNLVEHFWDSDAANFVLNRDDEIMDGCLITHEGEIVNSQIKEVTG